MIVVWRIDLTVTVRFFEKRFCKLKVGCELWSWPQWTVSTETWSARFETFGIYSVSQEECARLREGVPYVKLYRYNPKHLCLNLNGYGDNGQRSLKLWQLLHTYWLPNTYLNWQEHVVSVMLISVLNIKLTYEWHKAIKLNYKNTRTHAIVVLRVPSTIHDMNAKHWRVLPYHQEGSK